MPVPSVDEASTIIACKCSQICPNRRASNSSPPHITCCHGISLKVDYYGDPIGSTLQDGLIELPELSSFTMKDQQGAAGLAILNTFNQYKSITWKESSSSGRGLIGDHRVLAWMACVCQRCCQRDIRSTLSGDAMVVAVARQGSLPTPLALIYTIPGEKNIFSVKINSNELVAELKAKIHGVDTASARALSLYKIDVEATNEQQTVKDIETIARNLRIADRLNSIAELNEGFPSGVSHGMVHILVKLPEGEPIDPRACGVVPMLLLHSFHGTYSLNISPILVFILSNLTHGWNTNHNTSAALKQPDSSFVVDNYCLLRGEEEGSNSGGKELVQKNCLWDYGPLKWILGLLWIYCDYTKF